MKYLIRLVLGVMLVGVVGAVAIMTSQSTSADNPHPVVSGDTLWGIADSHTGDPFNWEPICDTYESGLDREARANGFTSSERCHWIFPGYVFEIPSMGSSGPGENGSEVNGINDDSTGGANGGGNGGLNGSGNGVSTNPERGIDVCDGVLRDTELGVVCTAEESVRGDREITLALIGMLEDEREGDGFPTWMTTLIILLSLFLLLLFIIVLMAMFAWVATRGHHHHHGPQVIYVIVDVLHIFPRRRRRIRRRPGSGSGGSVGG